MKKENAAFEKWKSNNQYREYHIAVIGTGGVGKSCLTGMK